MVASRAERTIDKICGRGLPMCTNNGAAIESGNHRRCDGCGDPMHQMERMRVVVIDRARPLCFHDGCYSVWSTLKP
jgi:hypothetical protein